MLLLLIWCCLFIVKMSNCMSSSCATPPPPTLCDVLLCHVMCSHPPYWAWDSHHVVVVVGVFQEVQLFQFFGVAVMILWGFILFYFISLLPFFHPASLEKLCLGNAAHPPTFPKNHMLYNQLMHTHTHTRADIYTHPPASFQPSTIHKVHIQKLSHPLIQNPATH